jgi:integrase
MAGSVIFKNNSWYAVYRPPAKPGLKPKQKWEKLDVKTETQARRELTKIMARIYEGDYADDERQPLGTFLERWLRVAVKPNLSPATWRCYETKCRLYITPNLGEKQLGKVNALNLDELYASIIRSEENPKGLSQQSVRLVHVILHAALKQAVKWGLINRNPADMVTVRRPPPTHKVVLDGKNTREFLHSVEDSPLRLPVLLLIVTGMRRGELLALRWANVDLDTRTLYVRETVNRIGGKWVVRPPKTQKGLRSIPLSASLVAELRAHKHEQNKRRLRHGTAWTDRDLVIDDGLGEFQNPNSFTDRFMKIARRYGFNEVTPHSMRHGHASLLHLKGIKPKTIQERLGHASIDITMDLYTHVFEGMQEEATDAIEEIIKPPTKRKKGTL